MAKIAASLCFVLLLIVNGVHASAPSRGSAPYLAASDGSVEQLPLVLTAVDVTIAGVIADVSVRQTYENRGEHPIEAIYVFPGSSRAAIHSLVMRIGDRVIRADIREKRKAREEYEAARAEGKTASLLEQLDPSAFRMNIANILPGDRIEVELKYTELLVPTKGEYEFFFPNTVTQRYASSSDTPIATPASTAAEVTDYAFDLRVQLIGALPLTDIASPSHAIDVERNSEHRASITLSDAAQKKASTQDYMLRFRYAGDEIETGLLAYPEGDGGYFLLLAEPPRVVAPEAIPPREFIFVVDVSGSMGGRPLDISKNLMADLVASLRPDDTFNLLLFSGGSEMLSESGSLPANAQTIKRARKLIDSSGAGGGTELIPALETVYALPATPGRSRSIVIVTDGAIWADGQAFRLIRNHLGDANVFAFGIGPSVVRPVIERLARAGAGEPFIVDELGRGAEVARQLREYIDRPLLTGIGVASEGIETTGLEPARMPDLLAERPIVVTGRYRGDAPGIIAIEGMTGTRPYRQEITLDPRNASPVLSGLRHLWARERIQRLLDEQADGGGWGNPGAQQAEFDQAAEITALGLEYSLLTPYTSFVAVDERVRTDEASTPVQQPAVAKGAPAVAGFQSGVGYAQPALSALSVSPMPRNHSVDRGAERRTVAGRSFRLTDGIWTEESLAQQTILRIRPDSPAWTQLLGLCPEFALYRALGDRVLVVFGDYAILLTPDGFSDFPPSVLATAVRSERG